MRIRTHRLAARAVGFTAGARRWVKTSLADDFHVFAVDWSPECLKFTLDGRVTGSVALDAADWLSASLKGTVNIRLNLQVGSHYWGRVDRSRPELTRLPARLVVDYVRVFERR